MKYTTLGQTGLVVSRLAFGAMTFGQGRLLRRPLVNDVDLAAATRMIDMALEAGINVFDTADAYTLGQSEEMLGSALRGRRADAIIITKVGFRTGNSLTASGLSYRHIIAAAEASLKRLGTDYIDLYLLHVQDPLTPLEETARACEALVREGKVRYLGYSNLPSWMAQRLLGIQEANGWSKIVSAQSYYSLLGRDIEYDTRPFVLANNIGLMTWAPLASGFLSGKYTRANPNPAASRRAQEAFPPIDVDHGYAVVDLLKQIAKSHQATPAQVAIAWLLTNDFVTSVIIGANKLEQLEDNLRATDLELSLADIEALGELTRPKPLYPFWPQLDGRDDVVSGALRPC